MEGKTSICILIVLCVAWQVKAAANCTALGVGRFPEPTDTTCKNYTLCIATGTSQYTSYNYVCPSTSLFSPALGQCTTNYVCPASTTADNTTTSVCTAEGYIADPNAVNCSSYIECVDLNGTFAETTLTCPQDTFYNPNTTYCETDYVCSTAQAFSCSSVGRYPNPADTSCKTYYLCVLATNGTFVNFEYTCPSTSVFSPTSRFCTTSYTCPT